MTVNVIKSAVESSSFPIKLEPQRGATLKGFGRFLDIIKATGLILAALTIVGLIPFIIYHKFDHFRMSGFIEEMAINRYHAVREAALPLLDENFQQISEQLSGDPKEKRKFARKILKIAEKLRSNEPPRRDVHDYMQSIREKISHILGMEIYQRNKTQEHNSAIQFLHLVSHTFIGQSKGLEPFQQYGKQVLKEYEIKEGSYTHLGATLDGLLKKYRKYQRDSLYGKVYWMIMHPGKAVQALKGEINTFAKDHNSFAMGNANIKIGKLKLGSVNFNWSLGPGFGSTKDLLFKGHLQHLHNTNKGIHVQHGLESTSHPVEFGRVLEQYETSLENEKMIFMTTPLDGDIWHGKDVFKDVCSSKDFHKKLQDHLGVDSAPTYRSIEQKDNNFFFPEEFAESDVKDLVNLSDNMFSEIDKTPYAEDLKAKSPARFNKALLLGFNTLATLKMLFTLSEKNDQGRLLEAFMGQACKHGIDRGAIQNVMTLLFFDRLSGNHLSQDRIHQIAGIILGRAVMLDDRIIIRDRYEALSDLLHMVGDNQEAFFAPFERHFQAYGMQADFIPATASH